MSRITTTQQAIGVADLPLPADEPAPVKKTSKTDAAKADVATETKETP